MHSALANGDYLVQERVPTAREVFPALTVDGAIQFAEQLVDLDPLLFNGKVGSAFTRLSSNELANVTAGGGLGPALVFYEEREKCQCPGGARGAPPRGGGAHPARRPHNPHE